MAEKRAVKRRATNTDWAMGPLIPGAWRDLSLADACAVIARLSAFEGRQNVSDYSADLAMLQRARVLPLMCLPGWILIEVEGELTDGARGCMAFVMGPKGYVVPIDWTARTLPFLIREGFSWPLSPAAAIEYALFYAGVIFSKGQRFRPIGRVEDAEFADAATEAERAAFSAAVKPMEVEMRSASALIVANMVYAGGLYRSCFELSSSGATHMVGDEFQVASCLRLEVLRGNFRVLLPFAVPPATASEEF